MNVHRYSSTGNAVLRMLICVGLLGVSNLAFAQATRTWVSGVGDDVNPCSRTAPCKTFAGAISKTAAGGEIDALDPGGFGSVTITKALTIDGSAMAGGILASLTYGITVNAGAGDVVRIRNMSINGSGNGLSGIRFLAGKALHVENVRIHGFTGDGIAFLPSGTSKLFVKDSKIYNNFSASGGGIEIAPTGTGGAIATLNRLQLEDNTNGLVVRNASMVSIRDSVASGNSGNGIVSISTTDLVDVTIENCMLSNNGSAPGSAGGVWSSGPMSVIRVSNNTIANNEYGMFAGSSGQILSYGNNKVADNTIDGNPTGSLLQK